MKKEPEKTQKIEKKLKKEKYQVIRSSSESSFGYWIIPLIAIILIAIIYILIILFMRSDFNLSQTTTNRATKNYSLENLNINNNRTRAGAPIDVNETTWGRSNPLAPPE